VSARAPKQHSNHPKEIDMNNCVNRNPQSPPWIPLLVGVAAAILSTATYAEYRCAKPEQLTAAEARACELARRDSPEALIHFVNRTKGIYGLYVNDYVSEADAKRWEEARQKASPEPVDVAKAKSSTNSVAAKGQPGFEYLNFQP
jgi:hypothetical protein